MTQSTAKMFLPLLLGALPISTFTSATPVTPISPRQSSGSDPKPFDPSAVHIPPMLRFECSQLVIDRIDPLVNPGVIPSPHLHQIVGGNSFNATLSHDLVAQSTCTSCVFSEDFSNYWTAVLYFRARNGTYRRVPQGVSEGLRGHGGITVYYIPPYDGVTEVTAFRPGFRMLVGDATLRQPAEKSKRDPKVCHRCMPKTGDWSNLNCDKPDTDELPGKFCEGGIRSVITFPTCWDGVNLDSADHKSHVAYPVEGNIMTDGGGRCPDSHPVKIPQVMYEVIWNVSTVPIPTVMFALRRLTSWWADVDYDLQRQKPLA